MLRDTNINTGAVFWEYTAIRKAKGDCVVAFLLILMDIRLFALWLL